MPEETNSLRLRIARRLAGAEWPDEPPSGETTTLGLTEDYLAGQWRPFFELSNKRGEVYRDVEGMDTTVDEVATALDILADNAIAPTGGGLAAFNIVYGSAETRVRKAIDDMIQRTRWHEKAREIARATLKYGDEFRQVVVDKQGNVVRIMHMPPQSMYRNEDQHGLLKTGEQAGEWAFEQRNPGTNEVIAGFYPWQMLHLRWNKTGGETYGRSTLYTARVAWRKLQAMEEALVINWITRAFARLLFILDVTGKSEREAEQAVKKFLSSLQRRRIAKEVEGLQQMHIVKDIAIGRSYHEIGGRAEAGLTDVKVLDTSSTGYMNLSAIEYYRAKLITSLRVPPAYLGLERDINAKATLTQEDRRFARYLERIQQVLSDAIAETIRVQLKLWDIDPLAFPFTIVWPKPGWSDVVEDANALNGYSQADERYRLMGVGVSDEWIATHRYRMTAAEWGAMKGDEGNAPDAADTD